jgi:hypothetical protein
MQPLSQSQIRRAMINATRAELAAMVLPKDFDQLDRSQLGRAGVARPA